MTTATLDHPGSTQAVIERPTWSDAEPPVANILPASRAFPDDVWLNIPNVPVFAEHETTTRSGKVLKFGRKELTAVCSNCNRRIRETGDYAGIVVGHTPDPESAGHAPPMPLVGLVGPFRVGLIRQEGGRSKWAILGDFHVHREQAAVIRQYPRRSAELWVEDTYDQMYLDPIALLGAETPHLDMGLLYSAISHRRGRPVEVEKYSACAPSATSVFVPTDSATKSKHRKDYAAADSNEPEPSGDTDNKPTLAKETDTMSPEDIQQIVGAIEQLDWVQFVKKQMAAPPPEAGAPGVPGDVPPPVVPEAPPAAPPIVPPPTPPAPAAPAAPDAGPPIPPAAPELPAAPGLPATSPAPPAPPALDDKDDSPLKYSRALAEAATLRTENKALRDQLESERGRRVDTERYSALAECRRTRLFDLPSEFEMLRYGRASDDQFKAHVERINSNYREIPLDVTLPVPDLPAGVSPSRPGGAANKEKYSKEVSDKALRICKTRSMRGEDVSYEEVLEQVATGRL